MKKTIAFLLSTIIAISIPFSCLAAPTVKKSNSEFGTLTGSLNAYGTSKYNDRKEVNYSSTTTKTAKTLIAKVDVKLYKSGKQISRDEVDVKKNAKEAGYYWECHNASYNKQKMSAFGCHEARGKTSLVVYTTVINF